MHVWVEVDNSEPGLRLVRAHRTWFGRIPKEPAVFEKLEVPDYVSDEPVFYAIELGPDEPVEGMSVAMREGGLTVTAEPDRFGDPDARLANGKKVPTRLKFEEWVYVA